jgi:hypothetical protein
MGSGRMNDPLVKKEAILLTIFLLVISLLEA